MRSTKIKETETETVEFKKSTSELEEGIFSIAAILNKHRKGSLYFGVRDDGEIIGQEVTDKTLRSISQAISNYIEPRIFPIITEQIINDKHIILIEFDGSDTPYSAYGLYKVRVADENRKITKTELEKLFCNREVKYWDSKISESTINDIDSDILIDFYNSGFQAKRIKFEYKNIEDTIDKLGLLSKNLVLNAGHIAFSHKAKLPVKMGVFATDSKNTINDMNYIKTNLYDALRICVTYFRNNTKWKVEFSNGRRNSLKREEIPEVPFDAFREALLNSFIHRDMLSVIANELCIFKDRIEIYNPGEFNNEYDIEEYLKGVGKSVCRNKLLADTVYLSEDIETFGTGLKRINDLCKEADVKVDFVKDKTGFTVIFWRKNIELEYVRKFDFDSLTAQEKRIVLYLEGHHSITRKGVENILSIKRSYSNELLNNLINKGIIISEGRTKSLVYKLNNN